MSPSNEKNAHPPVSYNVTIKHLRAFLSLAQHRSFTRAAIALHASQPSLTMTIQQLEDIVGCSLFDRTTRNVLLTPEGEDFLPVAERLIVDFDLALQNIRVAASARKGRVGIAVVHSVATRILPRVLGGLLSAYPGLHVQLRDGNSADVRRRVRQNEVDLGFGSKDEEDADLEFTPLFRDQMGLLARYDHPLIKSKKALKWADLAGHDFVGLASDTATGPIVRQIPHLPQSVIAPRFEASTNTTLWALLESGIGVTTTPALSIENKQNQPLRFRALNDPIAWRHVYVISRRGRTLTPMAMEIMRRVRAEVASIAGKHRLIEADSL
ncbi:LysR family transcriptional regulator [Microvirga puerhi]|uniref:LysR family transcriptional regulator n=1 Tax=Microvirga puerhi TaxID=2876078 RepID=A0ABS7VL03_9HYPH|nr:LysR family transcriptional regulator [Microvirga puerhi]MBZ6075750.1 LysR family transcriptional regulator [Microvirga puerhi]